ncbi:MAG: metallophosphoesterase family protein, partial [Planctomycetota bacterium]
MPDITTRQLVAATLALGSVVMFAASASACGSCDCCATGHTHDGEAHTHGVLPTASQILARDVTVTRMAPTVTQRFIVVGDTQGDNESGPREFMPSLISSINQHNASRMVVPGDLVGTGGASTWDQWITQASQFNGGLQNIIMTPGNHDQPSGSDALWQSTFDQTPGGQAWL